MKKIHAHRCQMLSRDYVESRELRRAEVLAAEIEEGNNEYKFKLTNLSDDQFVHRITQLNWRLNEGCDEAVYEIGVEDDGNPLGLSSEDMEESLVNLKRMADSVGCDMTVQHFLEGEIGTTAKVLLKRTERLLVAPVQVQVAVAGPADTGKSTLIAVLSSANALDNGKGLARTQIFRHNHEVKSGRTSSNTQHNLYFGATGKVLNSDAEGNGTGSSKGCSNRLRSRSDMELADETCRTISFIDLAGSSKYLKTTLHGIVGHSPDYFILVISARRGMEQMTSEFLGLCFALQLNLIIVVTKIDTVNATVTANVVSGLVKMLSRKESDVVQGRCAVHINSPDQLVNLILDSTEGQQQFDETGNSNCSKSIVVPIFLVSSVTGDGLDLLRSHLFQLPHHTRNWTEARSQLTQVRIIGSFEKRDEKSSTTEAPGSKVDALLNTVLAASSNGICARKCIGTRSNSSPISSALRSSNLDGGINKTSRKLSASGNSSAIRTDYKKCEMERRGDISNADATSIASLWIDSAKSPSPPPPSASICVTASRIERTALSSSGRSGPESIFSQSDSIFKNAEESGTNSFLDTSSEQASGINCDYKKSCSTISFAASTLMGPDTVLFGQILSGVLTQGDRLVLGPIGIEGTFSLCSIQSIRVNDVPVRSAVAGQTATMVLNQEHEDLTCQPPSDTVVESTPGDLADQRLVNSSSVSLDSICSGVTSNAAATVDSGDNIRCRDNSSRSKSLSSQVTSVSAGSGLVLLSPAFNPVAYWEFEAEVLIINHPGKIKVSYEPVVHFLGCCVRQSARIVGIRRVPLSVAQLGLSPPDQAPTAERTDIGATDATSNLELLVGDKAICRFRFLYRPEYIFLSPTSDSAMVMREGRTKGVGKVLSLSCPSDAAHVNSLKMSHLRT